MTQRLPNKNNEVENVNSPFNGCPDEITLAAYADNGLSPNERARLLLHLRDCATCRDTVRETDLLSVAPVAEVTPADIRRVQRACRRRLPPVRPSMPARRLWDWKFLTSRPALGYALAACCLAVFGVAQGVSNGWLDGFAATDKPAASGACDDRVAAGPAPVLLLEPALISIADRLLASDGIMGPASARQWPASPDAAAALGRHLATARDGLARRDPRAALASFQAMETTLETGNTQAKAVPGLPEFLMNILIPAGEAACDLRLGRAASAAAVLASIATPLAAMRRAMPGSCDCDSPQAVFTLTETEYQNLVSAIAEARSECDRKRRLQE